MNQYPEDAHFCAYCFTQSVHLGRCGNRSCGQPVFDHRAHQGLRPGTILKSSYQVGAVLGSGTFGITYRAKHVQLNKFYVLKELFPEGLVARDERDDVTVRGYEGSRARHLEVAKTHFLREAKILADIDGERHPEIVKVYDFFEENGSAYIVMPFLQGQTLGERIATSGMLDESELLHYLRGILRGLRVVHRAGILHQDLKPENIYLVDGRLPVLIDFGLAQGTGAGGKNLSAGTAGYAPPEQAEGRMTPSGDIYSLGATVYAALTAVCPPAADRRQLGADLTPSLESLKGKVSPLLLEFLAKALQLRPEDRYAGVDEVFAHLRPLLEPVQDWIQLLPKSYAAKALAKVHEQVGAGKAYALVWNWWPALFSGAWFLSHRVLPPGLAAAAVDVVLIAGAALSTDTWYLWLLLLLGFRVSLGLSGNWLLHRDLAKHVQTLKTAGGASSDKLRRALQARMALNPGQLSLGVAVGPVLHALIMIVAEWEMDAARARVAYDIQANRLMCKIQEHVKTRGAPPTKEELALPAEQAGGHIQAYELEGAHLVVRLQAPKAIQGRGVRLSFDPSKGYHARCENLDLPGTWVPAICDGTRPFPKVECG